MSALRRLLLGSGRLPERLRVQLAGHDVLVLEECLFGSVTYRDYRAPGERTSWSKQPVSGAIAMTADRLIVWAGGMKHIDLPRAHRLWAATEVEAETAGRVRFAYDAGATNTAMSGRVEVRLRTGQAARIAELHAYTP